MACPTHRDHDFWITAVKKSIGNDIAQFTNLQLSDLTSLITADSFNRIWDKATFDAVISCSRRLMQQHGRLYEKISFIGKLHRSLASATHFNSTHGLFCLWESAFKVETARIVVLESCLKAAVSQPDIFKGPQDFVKRLCIVALTFDDGEFFLSNPDKLATSLAVVSLISDGAFHSALWERLTEVISAGFGSISDAGYFYMIIIHHEASSAALVELATTLFTREFHRWCPGSFRELAEQESGRLCIIFQCLTSDRAPYTIHKADVMECNKRLETLVTNWIEDFRSDMISLSDLSHVRSCCSTACWNEIADFMSTDLPSEEEFCLKSDDFDRMLELIAQSISLQGSTSSSVQDVLKGYNCFFDPSTQLGRIFSDYSFLLVQQAAHSEATRERFAELNIMLRDVRDAATCVGAFRQRYDTEIHLCHYFLKNSSLLFSRALSVALERKVDIETLAVALAGAKDSIKSLFSPDADHEQVDEATRFIVDAVGTLERELAVLRASMDLELTDAGVLRFELISLLTSLERPLQGFITFCQHVKFAFVDCDPSFNELKVVNEFVLERKNAPEDILGRLLRILCPKLSDVADLKSVREHLHWRLPALQVVSNLSMNIEVWILAREMEWIGKDGIKRFHDEYANVTNVLLGSKQEMFELAVLDSLGVTIPVVGLVGSLMETTMLAKFLDGLTNNEFIASCHADSDFKDIKQVQCNISSIRDWFTNGVDEIAAVYGLFEAVKSTGEYLIMERDEDEGGFNHELVLRYMMENNGSLELKSMTGKHLSNFIQDVGLIQHDTGEFIEQYRVLTKASQLCFEFSDAGYDGAILKTFRCSAQCQSLSEAQGLLASVEERAREFNSWLRRLRQTYPMSLLFWTEELRTLHNHILNLDNEEGKPLDHIRQITLRLSPSLSVETDQDAALTSVLGSFEEDVTHQSEGWLVGISRFVERLHHSFGSPVTFGVPRDRCGEIVLHTIECDAGLRNLALQVLLQQIYQVSSNFNCKRPARSYQSNHGSQSRLPKQFEVLDCVGNSVSAEKLSIFLQRCVLFPGHTFVILHADHLEGRLMELLLSFFSSPETGCAGIRLHCVQGRGSILHTAPWVDGKTWDATSLDLLTLRNDAELHPWRSLIADRGINLSVVCSEISGSGKSRHIKEIIKCEKTHDAEMQIGSITLHEGTTIRSLIDNLVFCFSPALKKKAVHFSFTHMPERHSGSSRWLDDVNHFFSSVLILGCVHDPSSSISFRLGQGQWKIFVELPSENGVFAGEWLWRHIPVLAICGTFDEPSKVYAIDNATRRVCTYLRAFGNGTINRKFKSSAKRIVFVLDVSGSMSYDVGGGKSALMAAKENAIQIFDSHVQPGDVSCLLLLLSDDLSLIKWFLVSDFWCYNF